MARGRYLSSIGWDDEEREEKLLPLGGSVESSAIPENYRPWAPWIEAYGVSPFTGQPFYRSMVENPCYKPEARFEFEEDRKRAIKAAAKTSIAPGDLSYRVKVRGYIPQVTGVSSLEELEIFNPQFLSHRWAVKQNLGKSIASRRRQAKELSKSYFEMPKISISSREPLSFYKGRVEVYNTSGGRFKPKEGLYTFNSKGRWPKRDGHLIEVVGNIKSYSRSGYLKIPIFDLDTGESLTVPLGYLRPVEGDLLEWGKDL